MSNITITIEAETMEEIYKMMKLTPEKQICFQDEINKSLKERPVINKNFKLAHREGKRWTDFENQFVIDNYKSKNCRWIAGTLGRETRAVYQKLTKFYKDGLPRKRSRVKNLD